MPGRMYVADERFKANYEKIAEGLAQYQRDAMVGYADERLGEPSSQRRIPAGCSD